MSNFPVLIHVYAGNGNVQGETETKWDLTTANAEKYSLDSSCHLTDQDGLMAFSDPDVSRGAIYWYQFASDAPGHF